MVSTFTPNIQLEEPARGDQVGVWDTPVNANMTLLDLVSGGTAQIALNNSPVVLSAAQFQCQTMIFGSTLTGSVSITFPTSFNKTYKVWNTCTGSSAFTVTLKTSAVSGATICAPPGTVASMIVLGGNVYFTDLPPVGSYMDFAGSSVPNWISGSNPAPYLNCDGSNFSSAAYPQLANMMGTTLPDSRSAARYTLNQTTGRMLSSYGGLDGNTLFATKLQPVVTLFTSNLPAYTPTGFVNSVSVQTGVPSGATTGAALTNNGGAFFGPAALTQLNVSVINSCGPLVAPAQGGVSNYVNTVGTAYVGGITMIRAG